MVRIILLVVLSAIPTFSQSLDKYSYRREVTIQTIKGNKVTSTLTRKSHFVFDDYGRKVETEIQESGKSKLKLTSFDWHLLRDPPIRPYGSPSDFDAPTVPGGVWTNTRQRITQTAELDIPDHVPSVPLSAPASAVAKGEYKGKVIRLVIRYFDYRLFRTSVAIREVE